LHNVKAETSALKIIIAIDKDANDYCHYSREPSLIGDIPNKATSLLWSLSFSLAPEVPIHSLIRKFPNAATPLIWSNLHGRW